MKAPTKPVYSDHPWDPKIVMRPLLGSNLFNKSLNCDLKMEVNIDMKELKCKCMVKYTNVLNCVVKLCGFCLNCGTLSFISLGFYRFLYRQFMWALIMFEYEKITIEVAFFRFFRTPSMVIHLIMWLEWLQEIDGWNNISNNISMLFKNLRRLILVCFHSNNKLL